MTKTREIIARAMLDQFEQDFQKHGTPYDPDSVWAAADRVMAALASQLLGRTVEALHHPTIVGPATFRIDEFQED